MNERRAAPLLPARRQRTARSVACALLLAVGGGCGSATTPEPPPVPPGPPAAIAIADGDGQRATVATALAMHPRVRVTDAAGTPVRAANVTFTVSAGGGWTVHPEAATDSAGYASAVWHLGPMPGEPQRLTATVGAALTVTFSAGADPLAPGTTYRGADGYVEFTAGSLPLIVSAPHGGTLQPAGIPDRSGGVTTVRDANTDELARDIHTAVRTATGDEPHTIIVNLHRVKLDANREIVEAAQGNPVAERTWREYHAFIEAAAAQVTAEHGRGLYLDLHGHGHAIQRLELGYLLSAADLARDDAALESTPLVQASSMRTLIETSPLSHAALLRGPTSLGTLFEAAGYPAVPSSAQPHPEGAPYFTGGYNTRRHGSRDRGPIDGVQIEANMQGVRDNATSRRAFAAALVDVLEHYFLTHYGMPIGAAVTR